MTEKSLTSYSIKMPDKTLLLIDCFALIHRAFHAFPDSLVTTKGEHVNATYGFTILVLDTIIKFKPSLVSFVFDPPGKNFRSNIFAEYKANRGPADILMISQIGRITEFITQMGVQPWMIEGYEADDLIGTIVTKYLDDLDVDKAIIVTGDRDLFQLVKDDVSVYMAGSSFSQSRLYDAAGVLEKMGVRPDQIVDYKAIAGDPSDNIPGISGIGVTGATKLLQEFDTLSKLYQSIDQVPKRYQDKLTQGHDAAFLSQQLAQIALDVPIAIEKDEFVLKPDIDQLKKLFKELEFTSLSTRLDKLTNTYIKPEDAQLGLESAIPAVKKSKADDLLPWEVKSMNLAEVKEVFILANCDEADAHSKRITNAVVSIAGKRFALEDGQIVDFAAELSERHLIITNQAKNLYQTGFNKSQYYDVVNAGAVLAGGLVKANWEEMVNKYSEELLNEMSKQDQLEFLIESYKSQQEKGASKSKIVKLENDLIPVLAEMELTGLGIDQLKIQELLSKLTEELKNVEQEIYKTVGHEFNIGSPRQVGQVLFEERRLPGGKKTKSGQFATDERTLLNLVDADPIINQIFKYRELSKLISTYLKPLPDYINANTGRIHGNFNQIGAVTGRFSSDRPNLQNLPIKDDTGKQIRECIIAADSSVLISFDYSQQELRILAELSGEEQLIKAFNEEIDIHTLTAAKLFDISIDNIDSRQRRIGKTVNFGIVYGISAFGLADRLKIPTDQAAKFINQYFISYPKVKKFFDKLLMQAQQDGFVTTMLGRQKLASGIDSKIFAQREAIRREVMNFPLQGSAADVMKLAMIELDKLSKDYPVKLVLSIHDELLVEYQLDGIDWKKDENLQAYIKKALQAMETVVKMNVPLTVDASVGKNWLTMEDV